MELKKNSVSINFGKELDFIQVFFQLVGLQYFHYQDLAFSHKANRSTCQYLSMISRLLILMSFMALSVYGHITNRTHQDNSALMSLIQITLEMMKLVIVFLSVVQTFMATNKIKKFYENINEILNLFNDQFGTNLDFDKLRRRIKIRLLIFSSAFTGLFLMMDEFKLHLLFSYFPAILLVFFLFYFIFFVDILNQMLFMLVISIKSMSDNFKFHVSVLSNLEESKSMYAIHRLNSNLRKLKACRKIYNTILDNSNAINESFGLTLLLFLITNVLTLTVKGYEIFIKLFSLGNNENNTICTIWGEQITNICRIFVLSKF